MTHFRLCKSILSFPRQMILMPICRNYDYWNFKTEIFLCHSVVKVSLKARDLSPLGTNVHPDGLSGKPGSVYKGTDNHRHGGRGAAREQRHPGSVLV